VECQAQAELAHLKPHASRFTPRSCRAFTMIEIALSLAIIGFALVAIIGVLPIGMNTQKINREETIINQDATVLLNAIRNGAKGLDELTNCVMAITNTVTYYDADGISNGVTNSYGYTFTGSWLNGSALTPPFPITNGFRIVGLLSTPKYMVPPVQGPASTGFTKNQVTAYLRAMSGPASEKFPQDNASVQELSFTYRLTSEVVPYWTNYFDQSWMSDPNSVALARNLQANLNDLRLLFRWPIRTGGEVGRNGQSFRTLVGGQLAPVREPGYPNDPAYTLYFFEPRNYVKAP